jgi:hypothetical protein
MSAVRQRRPDETSRVAKQRRYRERVKAGRRCLTFESMSLISPTARKPDRVQEGEATTDFRIPGREQRPGPSPGGARLATGDEQKAPSLYRA